MAAKPKMKGILRTFLALSVAFMLTRLYASFLAVLAPKIAADLELDPATLGGMASAFPFLIALAQPVNGVLLDRFGPSPLVPLLLLIAAGGSVLFASAEQWHLLALGYGIIGLGVSATLMGALVALSAAIEPRNLPLATGMLLASGGVGQLLTATPLAWLADAVGWRWAVFYIGCFTGVMAAAVWRALPIRPLGGNPVSFIQAFREYATVLRRPHFMPIFVLSFVSFAMMFVIRGLWAGPYLHYVYGLEPIVSGNILLALTGAMIGGTLFCPSLARLVGSGKTVVVGGSLITVAALLALAAGPHPLSITFVLIIVLGLASTFDAILLAEGRSLFGAEMAGRSLTTLNVATFAGASFVQVTSGWIFTLSGDDSYTSEAFSWLFVYLALLLSAGLAFYAWPFRSRDEPPHPAPGR